MGYRRPAAANLKLKTGARARRGDSARLQPRAGPNRASGQAAATEHRRTAAHRVDARVRTRTRAFEATSGAMSSAYAPIAGALDNGKSYNLERVLRSNIVYSDYYRQLCKVTDFMELVDEIYNEVDHCEPWMSGNARGPSTAFCNLFRLCTMELEDAQITHLIRHRDSPYIRALGSPLRPIRRRPQGDAQMVRALLCGRRTHRPLPGRPRDPHRCLRPRPCPGPILLRDHLPSNPRGDPPRHGREDTPAGLLRQARGVRWTRRK